MKKIILFLLFFSFSREVLASPVPERYRASSAKSVVETQVEGDRVEVYQSVETTVDGETIKKESNQPGKLEAIVSFSQETISPAPITPISTVKKPSVFPFVVQITEFLRNIFVQYFAPLRSLTNWFK